MSRQRSLFSTLAGFPVRLLRSLPRTLLALLVIAALALNAATLVSEPTFRTLSDIAEAVVGDRSVQARAERQQTELAARADAAEEDADALKVRIAELETEKARLTQELAETRVVYRGAERPAREAVAEASAAIGDRVSKAAARNVASMPGEALPFIGIAVVADATAEEIAGACALMEEIQALNLAFNPEHAIDSTVVCGTPVPSRGELWSMVQTRPAAEWDAAGDLYETLPEISFWGTYKWTLVLGQRIYTSLGLDADDLK